MCISGRLANTQASCSTMCRGSESRLTTEMAWAQSREVEGASDIEGSEVKSRQD